MAKYQTKSNKAFSHSLFEECFKDFTEEEKINFLNLYPKYYKYYLYY